LQRVDLHVHTRLSKEFEFDERVVLRLTTLGERRGLTGFALTEHIHARNFWDMHEQLLSRYPYSDGRYEVDGGMTMFSGCEITVQERVDFIVVGGLDAIQRMDDAFTPRMSEWNFVPALDFLDEAAKQDLLVISAHPFRTGKETAKLPLDEVLARVDAVEVNGRDHGMERKVAALAEAYDRPVSGGSDAHFYLQVGVRSTVFPGEDLSIESMKRGFEQKQTKAHCKAYAPAVVDLCKEIKRVVKLQQSAAEAVA